MPAGPQRLILPVSLRAVILEHARQSPSVECCGLLIGVGEDMISVEAVERAANMAAEPGRRFEIDPQVQFDLLRRLRGTDQSIVGHYHSHPGGPPAPSAYDLSMAHDPDAIWVIVALRPDEAMAAYTCQDQTQGFQPLQIVTAA